KFAAEAFRLALRRKIRSVVAGHVGLLPVAWMLWRLGLIESYAVVLHGIEAWRRESWLQRKAARSARFVVATTLYRAREFCFFNEVDPARCVIIPLASESLGTAAGWTLPSGRLKLLAVSRLSTADRYKGFDALLEAIRLALDWGTPVTIDIVGDGSD